MTYRYDDMQRLTRAEYTSGLILAYTYDKAGNRLNQQVRSGVMLTVNVTGSGAVTSDPTGIECRENCSEVRAFFYGLNNSHNRNARAGDHLLPNISEVSISATALRCRSGQAGVSLPSGEVR